ncbi:MAG: cupin domain-containing protein [Caldilineaceae bacterium]|nr:cupin domain-containing protein [Caldilineaceae bacterium]
MKYKYTHVYADVNGESHFADVTATFSETATGKPAWSAFQPVSQYAFARFPAGFESAEWHTNPCRRLVVVLSGEGEVEVSNGEVRRFTTNDVILQEDTSGKGHRTRVTGSTDLVCLVIDLPGS